MSHLYHWQKKLRLFLQKFGEHKQSKLLTLPYCVCCIAAFCRLRLRRFTTHKGGGELLQGGFCRSTWTNILAIEKILHDNIKNIYKILQGNIHKQRQSKIHKEKDIDNWCNRQISSIQNILRRQSWDQIPWNEKLFWTTMFDHKVARRWE